MRNLIAVLFTIMAWAAAPAEAAVPAAINYQGSLTNPDGSPLTGSVSLSFKVFTTTTGGTAVWGPQSFAGVSVTDGYFNVVLGPNDTLARPITDALAGTSAAYLEIAVNAATVAPRQQILSAPYAVASNVSENALKTAFTTVTRTSAYTMTGNEDVVYVNGTTAPFTLTLPPAAIPSGAPFYGEKIITIKRTDNMLANEITIAGTIDGASDWKLHTQNETYRIVRNGTEWKLLDHYTRTPWAPNVPLTIKGASSDPTKGVTTTDYITWKREGSMAVIRFAYRQVAAGILGIGDYRIQMPDNLAIDTTLVDVYTGTDVTRSFGYHLESNVAYNAGPSVFGCFFGAFPVSSSLLALSGTQSAANFIFWGPSGGLGNVSPHLYGWVRVPIAGWKE